MKAWLLYVGFAVVGAGCLSEGNVQEDFDDEGALETEDSTPNAPLIHSGVIGDDGDLNDDGQPDDGDGPPDLPSVPPPEGPYPIVPSGQLAPYLSYFPELTGGYRFPIPLALLSLQDQDFQNVDILVLHNDDLEPLGFARPIFTDVGCTGGYCDAIRIVLVYDAESRCIDVFNASAEYHLKKFRPLGQRYIDFDEADMAQLRVDLLNPPQVVLDAPSAMDLVSGTHGSAPTRAVYTDHVVPGAAFTCWTVLTYSVETRAIIENQAAAFDPARRP
jgi:hypothetical protein